MWLVQDYNLTWVPNGTLMCTDLLKWDAGNGNVDTKHLKTINCGLKKEVNKPDLCETPIAGQ